MHAHLTDKQFEDDLEAVLNSAQETGVTKVVTAGHSLSASLQAVELSKKFDNVFATVGIHPENVEDFTEENLEKISKLTKEEKVVAVGEIGLDYHWTTDTKTLQKEAFIKQLELANRAGLPIVVHSRDAIGDTIEILKTYKVKKESLIHCYSGSVESAKILLDLGFSFSFGGVTTFKNAKTAVEVVKSLPIENILVETDCPYLAPVPFRGQRNEPKNIKYICDTIAKIKGLPFDVVAQKTTQNAKRLFKI